jgi:hypothetical protein
VETLRSRDMSGTFYVKKHIPQGDTLVQDFCFVSTTQGVVTS